MGVHPTVEQQQLLVQAETEGEVREQGREEGEYLGQVGRVLQVQLGQKGIRLGYLLGLVVPSGQEYFVRILHLEAQQYYEDLDAEAPSVHVVSVEHENR